jgi:nucleoside-diphosphate-sugar epimerase
MKILITGSTGFIGSALVSRLIEDGFTINCAVRNEVCVAPDRDQKKRLKIIKVGDLRLSVDWKNATEGVETIVHLAARAHNLNKDDNNSLSDYYKINVEASLKLARQAASVGVRRFIYMSSIKVNGESTAMGRPFTPLDIPMPQDAYGRSKHQAEMGLIKIAAETGMEVVIIRSPLVYGPGVKGNFLTMVRYLSQALPIPLGSVSNLRSLISLDNLVNLIVKCILHPAAANQVFLVSDGEDISTPSLIKRLGGALGARVCLISVPIPLLYLIASIFGYLPMIKRLCSNLQLDSSKTKELLNWTPLISVDEGLRLVAQSFKKNEANF